MVIPLATANEASVYHCEWADLAGVVPTCSALLVDAPYSERTHGGHDSIIADDNGGNRDGAFRRAINYKAWSEADVSRFVGTWSERVSGWMVSITDDVLAPVWSSAFELAGRLAFAPLPFVAPGSRCRISGDGPSTWTTWIVVARPRNKAMANWGTLRGAYILPPGHGGAMPVVGGKPIWLLSELVKDYSRPGDLVVDPCCGAGTLAAAAIRTGRRAIVGDALREHADLAAAWIANPWKPAPRGESRPVPGQLSLLGTR